MRDRSQSLVMSKAYFDCQCRCVEEGKKGDRKLPFVTISRQTGAGGITIGNKLIELLNREDANRTCPWTLFDKNLVEKVVEEHHFSKEVSKYMPEDKISELRDLVEEMFGLHPSEWTLVHRTSQTILHLAEMGNVILVGRGANIITRKLEHGFHLRLVGSLEKRIAHAQDYYRVSREEAKKLVEREDKGRKDYIKKHFDKDIDDPLLYHLVINTDFVSYEQAVRMICDQVLHASKLNR